MKRLREVIEAGQFAVTVECEPPKGTDLVPTLERARRLVDRIHGMNVTDNQTAVMRMASWAVCVKLLELGIDPVLQITCRDRNRLALQSDLLGASALGIRNILALRGDNPEVGDHKEAKPVFDLESSQLMDVIRGLNEGHDMAGKPLRGSTQWFIGAAAMPEADPVEPQLASVEKKIKAGAKFFQTQAVYNPERVKEFVKKSEPLGAKILAGIVVIKSLKMAERLNTIPGISIPPPVMEEVKAAGHRAIEAGIDIAVRTIKELRHNCAGVHIMAVGMEERIPEILDRAGL
ncbi:MAG TPA: methylenetetrahydrofolate reductase [Nitrospiria bacterium]|nr:methylenetetrahydrofolate reductase [Nitrospiria bacterium]